MRAHPRSRGENWRASVASRSPTGSSPLTRGKHPLVRGTFAVGGLIPAHAGKTGRGQDPRRKRGAHPRSRGENTANQASAFCDPGSSPLTRGKRRSAISALLEPGLIPAHAGKTSSSRATSATYRAHPRSRGENSPNQGYEAKVSGSSPLTRGKRAARASDGILTGLIPAHAGKTAYRSGEDTQAVAHPRSRGENWGWSAVGVSLPGSSPLTRGKLEPAAVHGLRERLIPAHAGKTISMLRLMSMIWAHPRSRGENAVTLDADNASEGSSPLTRGKRGAANDNARQPGLIPAHAGKTGPARVGWGHRPAHPRSRGENVIMMWLRIVGLGSSPLTRGKPLGTALRQFTLGLIPAHAGKTVTTAPVTRGTWAHPRSRGENQVRAGRDGRLSGSSPLTRGKLRGHG